MASFDIPLFLLQRDRETCFLTDYLSTVYENEMTTCDVVIVCSSSRRRFKAHRTVLAAASPFFYDVLKDLKEDELYIILENYTTQEVEKLMEILYRGSTMVSRIEEASFAHLMEEFEIGGCQSVEIKDRGFILENNQQEDGSCVVELEEEPVMEKPSDKTLKCTFCGQVLNTKTGLRLHLLAHKGSKQFTCDICGRGFCQGSQLKTHMRIHTGEKPYKCDVCDKAFSHASTLSEHKNLHTADKPFQCTVCQQSFAQRKALRVHRCEDDSSDKAKMFLCPYCNRSFTTRRGLGIHRMHQHAETSSEPLLQCDKAGCGQTFSSELAYEEHQACHIQF